MNINSEDEIFSILKPVETCLAEDDKARLWARIRKDSLRMRAFRRAVVIAVSAAAAIVAGVAIYFTGTWRSSEPQYISESMPEAGGDIRIETSDKVIEVSSDATVSYHEGYFSVSDSVETKIHDIKKGGDVHQMIVPFGKTACLNLSDGTKMQLNSGTRVIYKAEMNGRRREIYLNGEAFLDVFHDETSPFSVKTDRLDVSVLGT